MINFYTIASKLYAVVFDQNTIHPGKSNSLGMNAYCPFALGVGDKLGRILRRMLYVECRLFI